MPLVMYSFQFNFSDIMKRIPIILTSISDCFTALGFKAPPL